MSLTASEWLVLDNIAMGWHFATNIDRRVAEEVHDRLTREKYLEKGRLTDKGRVALIEGHGQRK